MIEARALRVRAEWRRLLLAEPGTGRADRFDFLFGLVLVAVLLALAVGLFGMLFAFAEGLSADGAVTGVALIAQLIGFVIAGTVALAAGVLTFAFANLIAKRMRDLGLPGWKALGIAWLLGAAFSLGTPLVAVIVYIVAVWSVLLLMPSARRD